MTGVFSKIFKSARPVSPSWAKLTEAQKAHMTDFGKHSELSAQFEDTRIDTPVGCYVIHHDGTFTDDTHGLMWIQAYWGMHFNGKRFKGEYLRLPWTEATSLFGRGGVLPKPAGLTREYVEKHGKVSYTPGSCRITFAGYSDWRLPTAGELLTLTFCNEEAPGFKYFSDTKACELRERLFPDCPSGSRGVWSADENGGFAWACDGHDTLGDYKYNDIFASLFARRRGPSPA